MAREHPDAPLLLSAVRENGAEHPCDDCCNRNTCAALKVYCDAYSRAVNMHTAGALRRKHWAEYSRTPRYPSFRRSTTDEGAEVAMP